MASSTNIFEIFEDVEHVAPKYRYMFMRSFLPARPGLFTDGNLTELTFPIYLLKLVTEFYGIAKMPAALVDTLQFYVKDDDHVMLFVWLQFIFDPPLKSESELYKMYKTFTSRVLRANPLVLQRSRCRSRSLLIPWSHQLRLHYMLPKKYL